MKVLNLYSGLGGNRKYWQGVDVTAVEHNEQIANVYRRLHPNDTVIVGDAHQYLLDNHHEYDFIWSSPPCPTHSKMAKATKHDLRQYPDMRLYQEIIFLEHFFKGKYVVENVNPYYKPLLKAQNLGRHLFWANFYIDPMIQPVQPKGFINMCTLEGKRKLMEWLDIHFEENIYYGNNHDPSQVLRNCVHPEIGKHVFECRHKAVNRRNQISLKLQ